jgi:hypothetical protein
MAVAVTGGGGRSLGRPLRAAGIAGAIERLVELAFEHGLQQFAGPIPKPGFNRIEPVVEKGHRSFGFRLRLVGHRATACHGVISAGTPVPEALIGPSWRLRRLQFPTTPVTAPIKMSANTQPYSALHF